jgi:tetratricopeptide (TPR) repeat protein
VTSIRTIIALSALSLVMSACSWFDNQTTYFNTYYNMQRIMGEIKDEFAYQDENKRTKPRVLVPGLDSAALPDASAPTVVQYQFLKAFMVDRSKLQPVATKVDSILIKGSKVLANHPKSNYIEGSLFLMAESYSFRQEWIPSQQKCIELIERFADGDLSPDAHLLLSKDYLLQRKISQGKQTLSKTIDVAWYKDRYDILSQAYRIQAEMAMEEGEMDKAVAPYKQAIAQCEDDGVRAAWQVDVASIYYRQSRFELAATAFKDVERFTPDVLAQFESRLYHAACMVRLGKLDTAEQEFKALEANQNYTEWSSYIVAEKLALERARAGTLADPTLIAQERTVDTSYIGRPEVMAQNFQKAMSLYQQHDYQNALTYFAKAKVIRTPVYEVASKYYTLLKQWEDQHRKANGFRNMVIDRESFRDSVRILTAKELYGLARVHEQLGNQDSALFYYREAYDSTAAQDPERSRYLYAQARLIAEEDPEAADSLMMVLNDQWPNSTYGKEAGQALGFVADVELDDAAELYRSGQSFRRIKDYAFASRQFRNIADGLQESPYAPKALYALGWMYERDVADLDSALFYYGLLVEKYPKSEYARDVFASVEYALAKRNNVEVSDSVLLQDLDEDLIKRARAGELNVLEQMIDKNKDVLQIKGPAGLSVPTIPGMPPGGNMNDMLQQQLKNIKGVVLPNDTSAIVRDTTFKPPK